MKRFLRISLNTAAVLSLLLFLATCALWVRSYWLTQFVGWSDRSQFYGALSMAGLLRLEHGTYSGSAPGFHYDPYETPAGGLWSEVKSRDRRGGFLKSIGFASARIDYDFDGKRLRYAVYFPHWSLVALFAILPLVRLWRLLRRRPRAPGLCAACGYDMRATPNRCPECGAVPINLRQIEQH